MMNPKVTLFNEWMRDDPAIRVMGNTTFHKRGVMSAQALAKDHPEVFDELFECAADLREQAPQPPGPEWLS